MGFLSKDINSLSFSNTKAITSSYTVTDHDILSGAVLMVDTTAAEVVLTLPEASNFSEGVWRQLIINHPSGDNNVKILLSGSDTFVYSNTYFNLGTHPFSFTVGTYNNGGGSKWGLVRNTTVKASGHRDASWAAANFSSMTIIPFDHEDYNNQDELLVYTAGAAARYTVKTAGTYKVSYQVDIDSTGGSTWNATAQIYKNGVALDGTEVRTGNYGNEDQSMALIPMYVDLAADDYLDIRIDQNSLTGNLVHAKLNIEIRL